MGEVVCSRGHARARAGEPPAPVFPRHLKRSTATSPGTCGVFEILSSRMIGQGTF
ncbi:MAG: hypothetical protein QHH04_04550 [Methanolinea sp.]|nr:hypothetical protein [Methanolinea sp.]